MQKELNELLKNPNTDSIIILTKLSAKNQKTRSTFSNIIKRNLSNLTNLFSRIDHVDLQLDLLKLIFTNTKMIDIQNNAKNNILFRYLKPVNINNYENKSKEIVLKLNKKGKVLGSKIVGIKVNDIFEESKDEKFYVFFNETDIKIYAEKIYYIRYTSIKDFNFKENILSLSLTDKKIEIIFDGYVIKAKYAQYLKNKCNAIKQVDDIPSSSHSNNIKQDKSTKQDSQEAVQKKSNKEKRSITKNKERNSKKTAVPYRTPEKTSNHSIIDTPDQSKQKDLHNEDNMKNVNVFDFRKRVLIQSDDAENNIRFIESRTKSYSIDKDIESSSTEFFSKLTPKKNQQFEPESSQISNKDIIDFLVKNKAEAEKKAENIITTDKFSKNNVKILSTENSSQLIDKTNDEKEDLLNFTRSLSPNKHQESIKINENIGFTIKTNICCEDGDFNSRISNTVEKERLNNSSMSNITNRIDFKCLNHEDISEEIENVSDKTTNFSSENDSVLLTKDMGFSTTKHRRVEYINQNQNNFDTQRKSHKKDINNKDGNFNDILLSEISPFSCGKDTTSKEKARSKKRSKSRKIKNSSLSIDSNEFDGCSDSFFKNVSIKRKKSSLYQKGKNVVRNYCQIIDEILNLKGKLVEKFKKKYLYEEKKRMINIIKCITENKNRMELID